MKTGDVIETLIKIQAKTIKRWEALRRNKYYKIDRENAIATYNERLKAEGKRPEDNPNAAEVLFLTSPEGSELARKYGLTLPFNPEDDIWREDDKTYILFSRVFTDESVIEVIPQFAVPVSVHDRGPTKDINFLRDNRFLFLAIDLQKPKKDIMMAFERRLEFYLSQINDNKERGTVHGKRGRGIAINSYLKTEIGRISIFKIWDMKIKEDKSPWAITQELYSSVKGTSYQTYAENYNRKTRTIWERITNAIERAKNQIYPA